MAIKFSTTKAEATHCMVLVFGRSGMGKTTLIRTCPSPIIITSEKKLFALRNTNFPVILIETVEDLRDALKFCSSKKAKQFETVCLDSISDIAETLLIDLKKGVNDARQAYGQLNDEIMETLGYLKHIKKKHVYVISKAQKMDDEGIIKLAPMMPGKKLNNELAYFFDFVFCLEKNDDDENPYRYLITQPTYKVDAKGCDELAAIEKPDLGYIFKKAL